MVTGKVCPRHVQANVLDEVEFLPLCRKNGETVSEMIYAAEQVKERDLINATKNGLGIR